jgi:hypothetical protein
MAGGRASIELHAAIRAASPAAARPMIAALGRRHDREAAEALLELTRSPAEGLGAELLAASLAMAPALEDQTLAAAVWARSLDLRITEEAIAGLGRVGTAAQVPRLEKVLEGSSGTLYEATRAALVGIGRRLASAGEAGPAIAALEVAFRHGAPVEGDLRRLGRRVDLVAHGGRIDAWWWLAAAASPQTCATAGPPGAQLEALGSSGDPAPWRPIEAADSRGAVEIGRAASGAGVLWLAADVEPRAAAPIGILVRSGAAVALWLDGRALAPDPPDGGEAARYAARLGEGTSRLVARLCAPSPEALLVLQLEDESGRPLKFRIR